MRIYEDMEDRPRTFPDSGEPLTNKLAPLVAPQGRMGAPRAQGSSAFGEYPDIFAGFKPQTTMDRPGWEAGAKTPFEPQWFDAPGGGRVGMPARLPDGRTAQQVQDRVSSGLAGTRQLGELPEARQGTLRMLGDSAAARGLVAQGEQDATRERVGRRAEEAGLLKTLERLGTTSDEALKKAEAQVPQEYIGTPQASLYINRALKGMVRSQAFSGMDKDTARYRDKVVQGSRRDEEGKALNQRGRAEDAINFFENAGPDPEDDRQNMEFLTPSQRREYDRYMKKSASGTATRDDDKRIASMMQSVENKRGREFEGKKSAEERARRDQALELQNEREARLREGAISSMEVRRAALDLREQEFENKKLTAQTEAERKVATQNLAMFKTVQTRLDAAERQYRTTIQNQPAKLLKEHADLQKAVKTLEESLRKKPSPRKTEEYAEWERHSAQIQQAKLLQANAMRRYDEHLAVMEMTNLFEAANPLPEVPKNVEDYPAYLAALAAADTIMDYHNAAEKEFQKIRHLPKEQWELAIARVRAMVNKPGE
jgi:hypothetical protein